MIRLKMIRAKGTDFMRKLLVAMLAVIMLAVLGSGSALAEGTSQTFSFELTVDGKDTKEVKTGDIITVVLKLKRTDSAERYTMYAMQDEIRYDSTFFELVEGSAVLNNGISSSDVGLVDQHREFYMNYLSMSGGSQWESNTLIGSFQLKVIGTSGVTKITNQDYLVSLRDGSGSISCEANEVTIILSTDCVVAFRTNGGSELEDITVQFGEKIPRPEEPVKEGYELEGWYTDIHLTEKWDFDEDTVEGNMSLYAKWVEAEEGTTAPGTGAGHGYWMWWMLLLISLGVFFGYLYKKMKGREFREGKM